MAPKFKPNEQLTLNTHPAKRLEDFEFELIATGERAEGLYPVMNQIVTEIMYNELRLFETRGASGGVYWSPLKGPTEARKHGEHKNDPLIREGELRDSLSRRGHHLQILDVNDQGFTFGTRHEAAEFHTTGTRWMPRRPPLVVPAKHQKNYIQDISNFIFGESNA
jgi:hypothetical protein